MPLQATSGAASYDAFGGGVPVVPAYIEEVFSTYLYTGNETARSITNGVDLSTKGGMLWIKDRDNAIRHAVFDSARAAVNYFLIPNSTAAQNVDFTNNVTSFNADGFSLGTGSNENGTGRNYASWTFRKQPKFFDVVTFTANLSNANQRISHNLGSVPGTIIIKCTNIGGSFSDWWTYHRSLGRSAYLKLNATTASTSSTNFWGTSDPTSTDFGFNAFDWGLSDGTYVAYLFAHDAGGFGLTGTDNVISCGSYTGNGSTTGPVINLGYEPQWLLLKQSSASGASWFLLDNMRGVTADGLDQRLFANESAAEGSDTRIAFNATGFQPRSGSPEVNDSGATYIYIAIRRGPMKVPTSGISVFSPITYTGNSTTNTTVQNLTTSFAGDAVIIPQRTGGNNPLFFDKLRGKTQGLYTSLTLAEEDINAFRAGQSVGFNNTQTVLTGQFTAQGNYNYSGDTFVAYNFRRAPSFFDEVCYTGGTGTPRVLNHNLTTPPELVITKIRNFAGEDWVVHYNNGSSIIGGYLNNTTAFANSSTAPSTDITSLTSTTYTLNTSNRRVNGAYNYVAYIFATCAGVSKVGSYTGTGTTLQIDCGFTGGARFVLIKKTSGTGSWYVWDSSRGIVSGNDPYLLLNSTAAEVTNTDYIDTYSAGFEISSTAPSEINENGGSFIFLAIA
jgi:hypothetical protein